MQEVWSAWESEQLYSVFANESDCIPFWPHEDFAKFALNKNKLSFTFVPIPLDDWINEVLIGSLLPENFEIGLMLDSKNHFTPIPVQPFLNILGELKTR